MAEKLRTYSTLQCDLERTPAGAVLWVTLNRPAAFNALSGEMLEGERSDPTLPPCLCTPPALPPCRRLCYSSHCSGAALHVLPFLPELHAVFSGLEHPASMLSALPEDHPRVVVLRAAGRAFCGGVDIKVSPPAAPAAPLSARQGP